MKQYLRNNESGFTLLEALIAMLLSSTILLFLCSSLQQLNKINKLIIADAQYDSSNLMKIRGSRQIEWHLFLNQLENYLENTELVEYNSQSFIVKEDNEGSKKPIRVKYGRSLTGHQSFYRSRDNGHNAMLTDIKKFHLSFEEEFLLLTFIFQNNEEYSGRIWIKAWKQESNLEEN